MSLHTWRTASRWLAEAVPAVVVCVLDARGSAPRDAGTRMIVSAAQAVGTVGGGHLELKAIEHARSMLDAGANNARAGCPAAMVHYPLGPALGQCCGGAVTLGFQALDHASFLQWSEPEPMFHLQLYGAGHVGRAIARAVSMLEITVDWIDEREDEFPSSFFGQSVWPTQIRTTCIDTIEDEVRHAPAGSFYLVLTHNHDLDMRITEAILKRGDFGYLGLIGSMTKRQRFMHRFERRGIASELLERLTCPIGIEGIEGKEPELIAVSVVAQMLRIRQLRLT